MAHSIGFLSVKKHAEHGFFGGYLIVNQLARPLEFHCTLPVKPTRAQELLYGSTIHDFVCGEQIAKALVTKAKLKPDFVLTDCPAVLSLSLVSDIPVALIDAPAERAAEAAHLETPPSTMETQAVTAEPYRLLIPALGASEAKAWLERLQNVGSNLDLSEPFQRVTEALLEAHPLAKAA